MCWNVGQGPREQLTTRLGAAGFNDGSVWAWKKPLQLQVCPLKTERSIDTSSKHHFSGGELVKLQGEVVEMRDYKNIEHKVILTVGQWCTKKYSVKNQISNVLNGDIPESLQYIWHICMTHPKSYHDGRRERERENENLRGCWGRCTGLKTCDKRDAHKVRVWAALGRIHLPSGKSNTTAFWMKAPHIE